ncbi:MAG: phosphoribosylformylglycinamidine cyclo-ligase [Selenomonas sp.]|nr:phosphoribosylformylglycinamidine cyclo-ligase [Selenomonas sp.]MDY6349255.1 phosphoribosylformylglycinamidine cyclo-ligase [Selenomonas sp.]
MMKIHIAIGDIETLETENWQVVPDDRQQLVEIIGGVAVQDFGHVAAGDKISCTVRLRKRDFRKLVDYWDKRTPVDVTDEAGDVWENVRVIVKSYEYVPHFSSKAVQATLEFWRI